MATRDGAAISPQGDVAAQSPSSLQALRDLGFQIPPALAIDDVPSNSKAVSDESSVIAMFGSDNSEELRQPGPAIGDIIPCGVSACLLASTVTNKPNSEKERRKRKSTDTGGLSDDESLARKKGKFYDDGPELMPSQCLRPSDKSLLPTEIWHRIFTFTPPKTLGKLLSVNKIFNVYLDPSSRFLSIHARPLWDASISVLRPDTIWQLARRRFWHKTPSPLRGKTELDMWRLICSRRCHFCDEIKPDCSPDSRPLHQGPGANDARTIWVFGVRTCGNCLIKRTTKEIDLLFSSSVPSFLIPALPFVLVSDDLHVINQSALQQAQLPSGLSITKRFSLGDVETLKEELCSVRSMGGATLEEWLKGLDERGKAQRADTLRWEKWDLQGGITRMRTVSSQGASPNTGVKSGTSAIPQSLLKVSGSDLIRSPDFQSISTPTILSQNKSQEGTLKNSKENTQFSLSRTRTRREVEELKAARRAEIARRAMQLEPPLSVAVLARIPSFQAAIQITSPLDDDAWELLKPRLLSQRAEAEQREQQETTNKRYLTQGPSPEAKPVVDKDWDDVQAPLRAQISMYADEIIRDAWADGQRVSKDDGPCFAVEVLLGVRVRFYAEVSKRAKALRDAGQEPIKDPSEGPFTQKLTLENMKWLFDVKIKPVTEGKRKELFFCNGCEANHKAYGFEGVVQHYAAKHTNDLSRGSVVVHWRSEWPEPPPFHPDPGSMEAIRAPQYGLYHTDSPPQTTISAPYSWSSSYHTPTANSSSQSVSWGILPVDGEQRYGLASTRPCHEPNVSSGISHYNHLQPAPPVYTPYPLADASFTTSSARLGNMPGLLYPPGGDANSGYGHSAYYHTSQLALQTHMANSAEKYRIQLEYIVRNSRELWTVIASLKILPGDIKAFVVIHHVVNRFRQFFSETPTLAMFIDGLSNRKEMRPVRNVNGLDCRLCRHDPANVQPKGHGTNRFSLPQLVSHFQRQHIELQQITYAPIPDWSIDMVYITDLSVLNNLRNMANIDNQKLSLISVAFVPAQYSGDDTPATLRDLPNSWVDQCHTPTDSPVSQTWSHPPGSFTSALHGLANKPNLAIDQEKHQPQYPHVGGVPNHVQADDCYFKPVRPQLAFRSAQSRLAYSDQTTPNGHNPSKGPKKRIKKGPIKYRRETPVQLTKNRKRASRSANQSPKPTPASEEDLLAEEEEEERRRAEEIRAMWAADRLETARLALSPSKSGSSRAGDSRECGLKSRNVATLVVNDHQSLAHVDYEHLGSRHSDASASEQSEGDDLMAGLESQLEQQRGRVISSSDHDARYDTSPAPEHHSQREPSSGPFDPKCGPETVSALTDTPLIRPDYYHVYDNEPQLQDRHAPQQYPKVYELVDFCDSQGEYLIRRSIQPSRTSSSGTRPISREAGARRTDYDARFHSDQRGHDTFVRPGYHVREPAYEKSNAPIMLSRQPVYTTSPAHRYTAAVGYDPLCHTTVHRSRTQQNQYD
ncbi:hypothetical protein F4778DRAFT_765410 [Xylariomycetidae sp. FL2044]|nr:hypothetical protein F4778DRAFT_765410 [Xylariomycetidae sp. FL2044]